MRAKLLIPGLSILLLAPCVFGGTITEPGPNGAWSGVQAQPLGQTFTADAPSLVSAGFWFEDYGQVGHTSFTYDLLAGGGTNGPLLASSTISLPYGFSGLATATFDSVPLTVGQTYTLLITETDIHWIVSLVQTDLPGMPDYTGGDAILNGLIRSDIDLCFQIQTVPEPGALVLFTFGGLVGLAWWVPRTQRRRKFNAPPCSPRWSAR